MLKKFLKVIALFIGFFLLLPCLLFFYRQPLLSGALKTFAKKYDVTLNFQMDHLSLTSLTLTNLTVEKNMTVPKVFLKWKFHLFSAPTLEAVDIDIFNLDIPTLLQLQTKINSNPQESQPANQNLATDTCSILKKMRLSLRVKNLTWVSAEIPISLAIENSTSTDFFKITFDADADKPFTDKNISYNKVRLKGDILINCQDRAAVDVHSLIMKISQFKSQTHSISLNSLDLTLKKGNFVIANDTIDLKMRGSVSAEYQTKGQKFKSHVDDIDADIILSIQHPEHSSGYLRLKNIQLKLGPQINIQEVLWGTPREGQIKLKHQFSIKNIDLLNVQSEPLIKGVSLSGSTVVQSESSVWTFALFDKMKILNFKNIHFQINPKKFTFSLLFDPKNSWLHLNSKISHLIPPIKKIVSTAKGDLQLVGALQGSFQNFDGPLDFYGKNIHLDTEYGAFKNLNFKYSLLNYPSLRSAPNLDLSLQEFNAGMPIENITVQYRIQSQDLINIQKLNFEYDGAQINAVNFTIHPISKSLNNFVAQVSQLKLQKLLSLALKDGVTASGFLSGPIAIEYKNKIPTIDGTLTVDGPGWIRYQSIQSQKKSIQITDNPMDILYGYLYDFSYTTLNLKIVSDSSYKSNMTLQAYGYNPQYVKGKPLKLNVNLEQNLLAAMQSMMLTYDLPQKLKDRLEGVEAQ